jgi:hypothetical protein
MSHCLDVFLEFIYHHFPPGWLTVILAVLAAVTALPLVTKRFDPEKNKWAGWLHAGALFVFCGIAALEMAVINHADKESEARIIKLNGEVEVAVKNTTDIQRDLSGFIRTQKMVEEVRAEKLATHKGFDALLALKGKTANLAADIFNLLLQRSEMFTGNLMFSKTRPSNPQESLAMEIPYDEQTVLIFQQQKLGARAIEITKELEGIGLKDDLLRTMVEQPHNMIAIRIIANHLAALADQITPEGTKPPNKLPMP